MIPYSVIESEVRARAARAYGRDETRIADVYVHAWCLSRTWPPGKSPAALVWLALRRARMPRSFRGEMPRHAPRRGLPVGAELSGVGIRSEAINTRTPDQCAAAAEQLAAVLADRDPVMRDYARARILDLGATQGEIAVQLGLHPQSITRAKSRYRLRHGEIAV